MSVAAISAQFSEFFQPLFVSKRYKVYYGGRSAGRSWGFARALLLLGTQRPLRILCVRELQNSISDSVHKLLSDQIEALGLSRFYTVLQSRIEGANGTSFSFDGIKNNVNKIKSYEGIDICWVEEGNKVSKNSWGVLIPTIRKHGSEIWITFNPELDVDYTFVRFIKDVDLARISPDRARELFSSAADLSPMLGQVLESADSIVVKMTYRDNPWLTDAIRGEIENDKRKDFDHYLHIWEGHTKQVLEGVVFAKELRLAQAEGRITQVPYARDVPVNTFWDLGRANSTVIWFGQRVAMQYRVLDCFEASNEDIPFFIRELKSRPYAYGMHYLPHDGSHKRIGMKFSIKAQVEQHFPKCVKVLPKLGITEGISLAKGFFGDCWFDEDKCEDGLHGLRHYRYEMHDGQFSNDPKHDWASDYADAFRYMALAQKLYSEKNDTAAAVTVAKLARSTGETIGRVFGIGHSLDWMGH